MSELWRRFALCRDMETNYFFPQRGVTRAEVQAVKDFCQGCPVKDECLEFAMSDIERNGIWGGLSEKERRQLRRKRKMEAL